MINALNLTKNLSKHRWYQKLVGCITLQTEISKLWNSAMTTFCQSKRRYSWFSCDVTAAILVYRTTAKKVFWDFDYIIMQNLSDVLPLFCTPTWPSHHVNENQEFNKESLCRRKLFWPIEPTYRQRDGWFEV